MRLRPSSLVLAALIVPLSLSAQAGRPPGGSGKRSKPAMVAKAPAPAPVHLVLAREGNEVRFTVREQLVGVELPNDAVGKTSAINGGILLDGSGKVDSSGSKISVDLRTLTTDRARRDGYIKARTLVVDSFPTATLTVTDLGGLPGVLPSSGPMTFTLTGNFTVHGVTRATTWTVTAVASGDDFTGKASTHVTFGQFNMTQPRVPIVLSVVDDILLEYDFHFTKQPVETP